MMSPRPLDIFMDGVMIEVKTMVMNQREIMVYGSEKK